MPSPRSSGGSNKLTAPRNKKGHDRHRGTIGSPAPRRGQPAPLRRACPKRTAPLRRTRLGRGGLGCHRLREKAWLPGAEFLFELGSPDSTSSTRGCLLARRRLILRLPISSKQLSSTDRIRGRNGHCTKVRWSGLSVISTNSLTTSPTTQPRSRSGTSIKRRQWRPIESGHRAYTGWVALSVSGRDDRSFPPC